jgi:hypothetical protein
MPAAAFAGMGAVTNRWTFPRFTLMRVRARQRPAPRAGYNQAITRTLEKSRFHKGKPRKMKKKLLQYQHEQF